MASRVAVLCLPTAAALVCCVWSRPASAQTVWDRFVIRQNLDSKKEVAKPAFVELTVPKDKDPVYAVGIGVTYAAVARSLVTFGPSLEYVRNTTVDKEVNSTKLGAELEWQVRPTGRRVNRTQSPIVMARGGYKRDDVKDTAGATAAVSYTHLFIGPGPAFRPNIAFGPAQFTAIYSPLIGVEYEDNISAATAADEGLVARLVGQIDVALYPGSLYLDNRFEIVMSYAYREDVIDDTAAADDSHPFGSVSVNYYFVREKKRAVGLGVTYANGEDPSKGFSPQNFWQIGLRFQIKP